MKKKTKQDSGMWRRTLHYYWPVLKKYKWLTIGSIVSTPVVVFVRTTLIALISANMIDDISSGLAEDQIVPVLLPQGIALVVCYLFGSAIVGWLRIVWCWKLEIKGMYDLATQCFDAVATQSMQFHSDRFSGSLVSQTNKFVGAFERLFDTFIFNILYLASTLTCILTVLMTRVPVFALALIVFIVTYIACAALSFGKVSHLSKELSDAESHQTGQLADSISNIISVKSYGRESHERHRFANISRAAQDAGLAHMRGTMRRDLAFNLVNIGIIASIVVFLIIGVPVFGLTVSTLILIVNYSLSIMSSLWDVNSVFKGLNRSFGDAYEMTKILDMDVQVKDAKKATDLRIKKGTIDFNEIEFKHHDAKTPIFSDFSLHIKAGERVGLVGASGSGKTTLTKLLLRFADVQSGNICVDGQGIKGVKQVSLRESIAYVPQETTLFHRSIADNIASSRPDASREEIIRAAKLANAHEFIKDLPDGYDTLVGERGMKLSGGQRQRVAIARAILKDAPILVLDEATSALDSESEALIQDALEKLMAGRTSIVVAHRLSTIASMDRIVVLDNGKIAEQGSHQELLDASGAYHHLWSRQSGAFLDKD